MKDLARKLLLIWCALSVFAGPAQATQSKLMVVYPDIQNQGPNTFAAAASNNRVIRMWSQIFDDLGISRKMVSGKQTKTLFCSTGQQVWNYGTAGAYVEPFDAVMLISWKVGAFPSAGNPRADSTLRIAYNSTGGPTVPQLWAFNDLPFIIGAAQGIGDAACCSTGVSDMATDGLAKVLYHSGTANTFFQSGAFTNGAIMNTTAPAGGVRKHLDFGTNAGQVMNSQGPNVRECAWCDSIQTWRTASTVSADTASVWERLYNESAVTYPNAKPAIFMYSDGNGGLQPNTADSVGTDMTPIPCESDPTIMLCGLARLDSVLNHTLITKTLKRSIVIHGLCSRGARISPLGIFPADTATAYATMDSIKSLGMPVVYTINADPDSMSAYARDIYKAMENPMAKFSPEIWTAVSDTTVAMNGGNTSRHRPRDVWGRFRNRTAYGDGSATGADSSLWANLVWAKFLCDSATNFRTSKFLFAPLDDWSPKNVIGTLSRDSVLYAISQAGFVGVEIDVQYPASTAGSAGEGRTNPRGFQRTQELAWSPYNSRSVKLIGQTGYYLSGAGFQAMPGPTNYQLIDSDLVRIWDGFLFDIDKNGDVFPLTALGGSTTMWSQMNPDGYAHRDVWYRTVDAIGEMPRRAYIANFRFGDIGGQVVAGADPPARWGWWVIKSINNATRAMREINGNSIVTLTYPENIDLP